MQAPDLLQMIILLNHKRKNGRESIAHYLGDADKVEELLTRIYNAVYSAYEDWLEKDKKIDQDGERRVKQGLYQVETLLREIEEFGDENQHPESIVKSFRSSTAMRMKLVFEDLKPYSGGLPWLFTKEYVVGREFNIRKEQFIELLLDSNSSEVVPIQGRPGSGKSTLIRLAINDSRVQHYFHSIHTANLGSSLCHRPFRNNVWRFENTRGKKCLLILDDTSTEFELKSLLPGGQDFSLYNAFFQEKAKGSKIVVIAGFEIDVKLQVKLEHVNASTLSLPGLDDDESWNLFQKTAFMEKEKPGSTLMSVGYNICQKCENFPAVINMVASILSPKSTIEEWEHFLNVMTSVANPIPTILSAVELTKLRDINYKRTQRRHCFAWCSLLPKDREFQKDQIFYLWRAIENFQKNSTMTGYDLKDCFDEFIGKGYFLIGDTRDSVVHYKINHLVFELMKYVAGDDFCLVDNKTSPEPNHRIIRHASFIVDPSWEPPSWLLKAKQLQSLLLWPRKSGEFISLSKIDVFLSHMTHLRALHAEAIHCERLPDFFAKFEKLEYLRFGAVSSISLPDDIPALSTLLKFDFLYSSIEKLALNGEDSELDANLEQEQRLALLIKFADFKNLTIEYKKLFEQNSLEQTHKIVGSLNLQSTSFVKDDWEQTLLNPHQTVESLKVRHWKEESLPSWLIDETFVFLSSLLSIQIANCNNCKHLPGFNTLPSLSSLQLGGMCSLVDIMINDQKGESSTKPFYPSLKCLVLCDLPELEGWFCKELDNNQPIQERYCFPLLTQVRVQGCPKLNSMPSMPAVESLEAIKVNAKIVNHLLCPPIVAPSRREDIQFSLEKKPKTDGSVEFYWGEKSNDVEKGDWRSFRSLRSLKVADNPQFESLSRDLECITMLEKLSLCWLSNLKVLPEWIGEFTQLRQLRQLTIHYCPKLTMLPNSVGSFCTLEQLEIRYCPRLGQFPQSLPNLKRLQVQEFGRLEQILCVSQNLEELEINNCDQLEWESPSVNGDISVSVWERLNCLGSLKLIKMDTFPKGLDFAKLSKLSRLVIEKCPKLNNLPESLCSLSTLENLQIYYYPGSINLPSNLKNLGSLKKPEIRVSPLLEKRCKPDRKDWIVIEHNQHIPIIVIKKSQQQNDAEQQTGSNLECVGGSNGYTPIKILPILEVDQPAVK